MTEMYNKLSAYTCGKQHCCISNPLLAIKITCILISISFVQAMAGSNNSGLAAASKTIIIENGAATSSINSSTTDNKAQKRITGRVTDAQGEALIGVSVKEKGSSNGVTTDVKGNFTINVSGDNAILVFTYVGFLPSEVKLGGRTNIKVVLEESTTTLESVVVVGYGTQKKETVTGAISTIATKELVQSPVANISNALAGRLSGLTVTQTSGKPGANGATLLLRGVGTYTDQTGPLIMVDGIARDTYNDIDPNEIETISTLKDASATAVYGVRGANGVILITTKRGRESAPKVSVSAQTAVSQFVRVPDFVNSYQYATLLNEQSYQTYWINHAKDADITTWGDFVKKRDENWIKDAVLYFSPEDLRYYQNAKIPTLSDGSVNPYYDPYFHPDQDWKSQIFNKTAQVSQYNANMTGGTKSLKYFMSLGYLNEGGMFNTDYLVFKDEMDFKKNRYNLRGNFDFDVTKDFKVSVDLGTQFVSITGMDNDAYTWEKRILWSSPIGSPGLINGKFALPFTNQNEQLNPLYAIANANNYNITNNSILNSSVKLSHKLDFITKGMSVNARGAYDSYFSSRSGGVARPVLYGIRANPNGDKLNPIMVQISEESPAQRWADWYNGKWRKLYGEFSLNYNRSFGKHNVTGLVLGNAEKRFDPGYTYSLPHAYMGLAGRVTYNYNSKYLAEYNVGYNGSENFPEGKRFGFLPAYSLGWIASNESFFPKTDIIDYLKIRGSLGKVGNDNIGGARYLYLPDTWQYKTGYNAEGYYFGTIGDRRYVQGAVENVLGNPNVTWETATKSNIGVEAHFLKGKLSVIYDHYNEHRKDILSYKGTIPDVVQANLPPYNLGEVKNWGDELELSFNSKAGAFNYWVKGNASTNKNKIIFRDEAIVPGMEYKAQTGRRIGQELYFESDGLYTSWSNFYALDANGDPNLSQPLRALNRSGQEYLSATGQPVYQKDLGYAGAALQPGEVRLIDYNEDGVVNDNDLLRTGKTRTPELTYGISFGFSFKGFDFSSLLQGVDGVARFPMSQVHFNKQQSLFEVDWNRFTLERYNNGERIDFPIAAYNQAAARSTYFLKDASYMRLKNLEIGYTFQQRFIKKLGVSSARLYANGNNLYTFSANKIWGDPENLGYGEYPLTQTFNMGVNVKF